MDEVFAFKSKALERGTQTNNPRNAAAWRKQIAHLTIALCTHFRESLTRGIKKIIRKYIEFLCSAVFPLIFWPCLGLFTIYKPTLYPEGAS